LKKKKRKREWGAKRGRFRKKQEITKLVDDDEPSIIEFEFVVFGIICFKHGID